MEQVGRKICLDSDVLIQFLKNDPLIVEWIQKNIGFYFITSITSFEAWMGRNKDEPIKEILSIFEILPFEKDASLLAGDIFRSLKEKGQQLDMRDIFIAATCIHYNVPLFTLNKKHFQRMEEFGLVLLE